MDTQKLTPRENSVAKLISMGYSSKYVANRLFISARTVEVHIEHIYEKLFINSRDELIEMREFGKLQLS